MDNEWSWRFVWTLDDDWVEFVRLVRPDVQLSDELIWDAKPAVSPGQLKYAYQPFETYLILS